MHTEDAIGAIMRGKQVFIVGDTTKQLPPTSIFSASLNDEDFDVGSDEVIENSDAGAYESILDEAVAVLPERSLGWHYRSRNEHLIAFLNYWCPVKLLDKFTGHRSFCGKRLTHSKINRKEVLSLWYEHPIITI